MRVRLGTGLILLNLLNGVLILVVAFFPSDILRIILGIPFLVFFPGYTLMAAFFPKKEGVDGIERAAFSFVLSLAAK